MLQWLRRHQREDGSWSVAGAGCGDCCAPHRALPDQIVVGRTSLALLTFMANGHTHRFGAYKRTVNKGVRWLLRRKEALGSLAAASLPQDERAREQTLGALALCELTAMTRDPFAKSTAQAQEALDRAVTWHLPVLGLRPTWDALLVRALRAAEQHDRLRVPEGAWERVRERYTLRPSGDPCTDALGLLAAANREDEAWRAAGEALWDRVEDGALARATLDEWVLVTQALLFVGGPPWERYQSELHDTLVSLLGEGCWAGTADPVLPTAFGQSRVVATALVGDLFESIYRYRRSQEYGD